MKVCCFPSCVHWPLLSAFYVRLLRNEKFHLKNRPRFMFVEWKKKWRELWIFKIKAMVRKIVQFLIALVVLLLPAKCFMSKFCFLFFKKRFLFASRNKGERILWNNNFSVDGRRDHFAAETVAKSTINFNLLEKFHKV